ncbi:MAG: ABC transporter permease, partial [Pseudonocardiaceae bacterium]
AVGTASLGDLWNARELLRQLVGKELKVRYKGSALGFLWSLVTPLLLTGVFTVVFANFIRVPLGDGNFATFFLSGYLVWQFFSNSVTSSVGAIVGNGALIRKVWFRREVLPLSLVLSQAVHFGLALLATSPLFLYYRGFHPEVLPALLVGFLLLAAFTTGASMLFAAANVGFRDLQELTQVIFLAWFYLTPVIYPLFYVSDNAPQFLLLVRANPMTWFAELFHRILYGTPTAGANLPPGWPEATTWLVCAGWAAATLGIGYWLFNRLAVTFAKQV